MLKINLGEARFEIFSTIPLELNILDTSPRHPRAGEIATSLSSPTLRTAGNIPRLRSPGHQTMIVSYNNY